MEKPPQPKRTLRQNKALHLMYQHIADELNASGFDMKRTLKPAVDIPWSAESVKEYLWRPIQEAMLRKESTTELTTGEIDKVADVLNKHLGEVTGIHIEFPSADMLIYGKKRVRDEGSGTGI